MRAASCCRLRRDERRLRLLAALLLVDRGDDGVAGAAARSRSRRPRPRSSARPSRRSTARSAPRTAAAAAPRQVDVDRPVLLGHERLDLLLALAHQAHRDRLHAAGGQAALHLVPQDRADLVADEAIEDAARLLRVGLVHVDLARRGDRGGDALLRDLVDQDALEVLVDVLDLLGDVPRDRLAFAIGVGCEVDGLDSRAPPCGSRATTFFLPSMTS